MADVFRQATSWLYTGLAVSFLGAWSLIVLILVGLTAVSSDPGLLQLIALPSLLTFLVAKLVVAVSPAPAPAAALNRGSGGGGGNLATWIASADNGSPHGALVLLLFSVTWLLHLAGVVFALFFLVLFGGFFLFAASMNEAAAAEEAAAAAGSNAGGLFDDASNFTTALVEFEEKVGVPLADYIQDKPWLIFQLVAAVWAMSGLLVTYLVAYAFAAARKVLTTPMEAWLRAVEAPGRARVEDVRRNGAAAVVVEKERVVLPAGAETAN